MKRFKFTIRGHDYDVEVMSLEGQVARVEVNGTKYKVEIHTEKKTSKTKIYSIRKISTEVR